MKKNQSINSRMQLISASLQNALKGHGIDLNADAALDAANVLSLFGFGDCEDGCKSGCKSSCKDGCKSSQKES